MLIKGLAKTLFTQSYQSKPWLSQQNQKSFDWPLFHTLFEEKRISFLDYAFTHRVLREYPSAEEEVALFICHLLLAAKEGHLCVQAHHQLSPSVASLWKNQEGYSLEIERVDQLTTLILEGAQKIPPGLICCSPLFDQASFPATLFCHDKEHFYLQRHWVLENFLILFLKNHLKTASSYALSQESVANYIEDLCKQNLLVNEQAAAIQYGCTETVTLISGGPGTGKTYTIRYLIQTFYNHLTEEQKKHFQIVLTAPTGKAVSNLQNNLSCFKEEIQKNSSFMQIKTLHSLLQLHFQRESTNDFFSLNADLIIVDETSMVDIKIMTFLLRALKPGSHLILLGDQHQLPSVEAGSVFADLISSQKTQDKCEIAHVPLKKCLRTELLPLLGLAKFVANGDEQQALACLTHAHTQNIQHLPFPSNSQELQKKLLSYSLPFFLSWIKDKNDLSFILSTFQKTRLLSPLRKGPLGVESLNEAIWQQISSQNFSMGWLAIPIMIVKNDHQQDLFNGETGILIRSLPLQSIGREDYALFASRENTQEHRRFSASVLPPYEYAYCISVHKSQGSEFDHVILALPEGAEIFGREMLYTAITRARKQFDLYGSDETVRKIIKQKEIRLSRIVQRLHNPS
jgi:exodeoxyribonuclease V alpha subunit